MSRRTLYSVVGVWFAIVTALVVFGLATGVPVTPGLSVLVLVVGVVPPAVVFRLFATQDTPTVAEMLRR